MRVGADSIKWAMVTCVVLVYPLSILWRLGAKALPPEDDADRAAVEALTRGAEPKPEDLLTAKV